MPVLTWLPPILVDMLRHIYQRCILETNSDILELVKKVNLTLSLPTVADSEDLLHIYMPR